jgi:hypothetical protein
VHRKHGCQLELVTALTFHPPVEGPLGQFGGMQRRGIVDAIAPIPYHIASPFEADDDEPPGVILREVR